MKVQVSIRGRSYALRTDKDEDLRAIADFVGAKMGEILARSPHIDEAAAAVLTALNIAAEFERFRKEVASELATVDQTLAASARLLEAALPVTAARSAVDSTPPSLAPSVIGK
jgi:cell division protein ZapA (FtsZ GTPase activity inhibitor)